jgi:hypothetical protein
VVANARHVQIDRVRLPAVAAEEASLGEPPGGWTDELHWRDGTWKSAGWVLVLDALDFCFWSESRDPTMRWQVEYRGELFNGYWALVAALRRAVDEGRPLWDPEYLVGLTPRDVAHILRPPDLSAPEIPLFPLRVQNLHELGRGLMEGFPDHNPVTALIDSCEGSALRLVEEVTRRFRSFDDVTSYDGRPVRLYKRAQLLAADLHAAFAGEGPGRFHDLERLTAFADYKVPQVLRHLGVLVYDEPLSAALYQYELLPMGSAQEVEIRAATIWACELLRRAIAESGTQLAAYQLDWALWLAGQSLPDRAHPYHRTYTVFY